MRAQNGHCFSEEVNSQSTTVDTRHVSKSQLEFLNDLKFHGLGQLSESLKRIHDLALYHSDVPFDKEEKSALFDLKILWEGFERIRRES